MQLNVQSSMPCPLRSWPFLLVTQEFVCRALIHLSAKAPAPPEFHDLGVLVRQKAYQQHSALSHMGQPRPQIRPTCEDLEEGVTWIKVGAACCRFMPVSGHARLSPWKTCIQVCLVMASVSTQSQLSKRVLKIHLDADLCHFEGVLRDSHLAH